MKWISLLILAVVFVACRFNHHEQMTPHYVYTPQYASDCTQPGGQIVLEGNYQGKSVYVQNPFAYCKDTSTKFCAFEVLINDSISIPKDSLASSAFEIPLRDYGFVEGDSVRIVIKHYSDCSPKVLNPEVH
jgi:hypothetical protein